MNNLIVKFMDAWYRVKGSSVVHKRFFPDHLAMNRFLRENDDEVILLEIHVYYVDEKEDIRDEDSDSKQSWTQLSLYD